MVLRLFLKDFVVSGLVWFLVLSFLVARKKGKSILKRKAKEIELNIDRKEERKTRKIIPKVVLRLFLEGFVVSGLELDPLLEVSLLVLLLLQHQRWTERIKRMKVKRHIPGKKQNALKSEALIILNNI